MQQSESVALTVGQVSALAGCSVNTLQSWLRRGLGLILYQHKNDILAFGTEYFTFGRGEDETSASGWRLAAFGDVLGAVIMARLMSQGRTLEWALKLVDASLRAFRISAEKMLRDEKQVFVGFALDWSEGRDAGRLWELSADIYGASVPTAENGEDERRAWDLGAASVAGLMIKYPGAQILPVTSFVQIVRGLIKTTE